MYYPFLRGRQFELIALREYAEIRGQNNSVIPIIEPVKKSFNSMKLALPKLIGGGVKFGIVLNPQVGEVESAAEILDELVVELGDRSKWIPVFIVSKFYGPVYELIKILGISDVMIVCSEQTDTNNDQFKELISSDLVKYVLSEENRTLKRYVDSLGKVHIPVKLTHPFLFKLSSLKQV